MSKIKEFIKNPFSNHKNAFYFLFAIFFISLITVLIICNNFGGFFTLNTDDIAQYYPIMAGFIEQIKAKDFSLYNSSFYAGSSWLSNAYYIPLDIFTLLTFLFSLILRTETAYCMVNLMKPLAGGLLLFYTLQKQNLKPKTCFVTSLIYTFGGLYAAFCVFPVYQSLLFYIPLAVYTADRFRENKMNFPLVVIYTLLVVLYDFYLAYILLAFFMIYLVIKCYSKDDFSLIGKNTFIKNKKFYLNILLGLFLVFVGMLISLFYFLPNYMYITGKTFRVVVDEVLNHYTIKHYLIQFSTLFLTSNPLSILLVHGDYIRNHISLYITIFGLISLVQLFFLKGKEYNRIKFFVILFNFLLCIPLVAMIMTASSQAYIRWFFIVYFINLYAASLAMDKNDCNLASSFKNKMVAYTTLVVGIIFVIYLYFMTDNYTLYDDSEYYYPIMIIFFVTVALYIIVLTFKKLNKLFVPIVILEALASIIIVFTNCGNTGGYYYHCRTTLDNVYNNLKNKTDFETNDAYRAYIDSYESTYMSNTSFIYPKLNSSRFFHSFYDSTINEFYKYYLDEYVDSWSKRDQTMNLAPFSFVHGVKYHILPKRLNIVLPNEYSLKYDDGTFLYYELSNMKPFIVYDTIVDNMKGGKTFDKAMILSNYGSFTVNDELFNSLINKYHLKSISYQDAKTSSSNGSQRTIGSTLINYEGVQYVRFDIRNYIFSGADTLLTYIINQGYRDKGYEEAFILDSKNNKHYMYNGILGYDESYSPQYIYMKSDSNFSIQLLSFNMAEYVSNYLDNQVSYTNEEFILDGCEMSIKLDMPSSSNGRIIKTNFSYSDEWHVSDKSFETINIDGGFLGIVVPPNTTSVDVKLNFIPNGLTIGSVISVTSFVLFTTTTIIIFEYQKRLMNKKFLEIE